MNAVDGYASNAWLNCTFRPSKIYANHYMHRDNYKENVMNFKSSITRIAGAFSTPSRQQIERSYLNKSISINDLERRQNEIAHGKFHNI